MCKVRLEEKNGTTEMTVKILSSCGRGVFNERDILKRKLKSEVRGSKSAVVQFDSSSLS